MPKLLWVSPLSVHDTSNNSATQMRNMLLSLKARDVEIVGLSALNFLHESGTSMFTDLDEKLKGEDISFNLKDNNITFIYIRTKSRKLGDMISQEQRNFYAKFCAIINAFRPDVVMGTGSDMLSMVCFDEAHRRGIPTVYTLLDGTPERFNFPNIDVVITDSNATSHLYATNRKINSVVVGSFIPVVAHTDSEAKVERKRITMVNPSINKGLGIFLRLAQLQGKELKNTKFTVCETYEGQFLEQAALIHEANSDKAAFDDKFLKSIEVLPPNSNLSEVLKESKALLVPSLSFESTVNIAREAIAHGTPVLGTNQTGIAESIGDAGVLVEIPPALLASPNEVISVENMTNFVKGLDLVLNNDFTERCVNVTKRHDINFSANRLATILKPLFDKRAGNNPQLLRNGSLI